MLDAEEFAGDGADDDRGRRREEELADGTCNAEGEPRS
jgi:hypothetical protein